MGPDLYEAICTKDTPAGRISLHVPVIRHGAQWLNANTGHVEPWVSSVEPMATQRAMMFALQAAKILRGLS